MGDLLKVQGPPQHHLRTHEDDTIGEESLGQRTNNTRVAGDNQIRRVMRDTTVEVQEGSIVPMPETAQTAQGHQVVPCVEPSLGETEGRIQGRAPAVEYVLDRCQQGIE